ncbi:hypothetical protein [Longimicrobium sp.]|uniref:hypothetical protein n=1 Tax=Longimicrobium sp. TaxID=2029185 RepID=UPI002E353296|nr:hypothetical protein [Longimicrobium sp.]HEX6036850.1 hypothetical protein [Longimicrobium sp.]
MRFGVLALAGVLALPAAASAQNNGGFANQPPADLVPYTRFAITPWVGLRSPYGSGEYFAITESGTQYQLDEDRGGGVAVGLNAEFRITGPLNLVAGATYSAADEDEITVTTGTTTTTTSTFLADGPEMWFVKAGLQYRLPDPIPDNRRFHPAAYVTVAPALVVTDYPEIQGLDNDDVNGSSSHFGLNLAVDAVSNVGSRGLALSFGLEDYITFWNQDDVRLRDEVLLGSLFEEPVTINYDSNSANILVLRAGLSWRF